mmetsp:Transcript_11153/g.24949  ORF Transcript_11153/g.24949 Transcript_11153/m.24949 type:complete len:282 (+) Transcript_11153:1364-2209(+)
MERARTGVGQCERKGGETFLAVRTFRTPAAVEASFPPPSDRAVNGPCPCAGGDTGGGLGGRRQSPKVPRLWVVCCCRGTTLPWAPEQPLRERGASPEVALLFEGLRLEAASLAKSAGSPGPSDSERRFWGFSCSTAARRPLICDRSSSVSEAMRAAMRLSCFWRTSFHGMPVPQSDDTVLIAALEACTSVVALDRDAVEPTADDTRSAGTLPVHFPSTAGGKKSVSSWAQFNGHQSRTGSPQRQRGMGCPASSSTQRRQKGPCGQPLSISIEAFTLARAAP